MAEIRVHIDTLEYTRSGLKTKEPINLQVGQHNRVVLVRPKRTQPRSIAYGGFMVNSSFPTPPVLMLGVGAALDQALHRLGSLSGREVFQVYGHADPTGEDDPNKRLSDRRAMVVAALLTGDIEALVDISKEENWGLMEYQLALRVLRCDPGPIDGETGDLTRHAVQLFQDEYNRGTFVRHRDAQPRQPLVVDGDLGDRTKEALLDALVSACSPYLQPEQMHPSHPAVGCSEFNRVTTESEAPNRRVSLLIHESLPPYHDRAPCLAGETLPCPLDDQEDRVRCLWYREHVIEPPPEEVSYVHLDLRWLPLPNGKFLLSALTSAPEDAEVCFQVWRSGPARNRADLSEENLEERLGPAMVCNPTVGVAQVVWVPPENFECDGPQLHHSRRGFSVPVFEVSCKGSRTLSPPLGEDLSRIQTRASTVEPSARFATFQDAFGSVYVVDTHGNEHPSGDHPLTSSEVFVLLGTGGARSRKGER